MSSDLTPYISGSVDPTSVATYGMLGWVYLKTGSTPSLYMKSVSTGKDTNWTKFNMVPDSTFVSTFTLAAWPITANQWGNLASVPLTAGTWSISVLLYSENTGLITTGGLNIGISSTSGNSVTGLVLGSNYVTLSPMNNLLLGGSRSLSIPSFEVVVASPTTYYFKGMAETSISNLQAAGRISARRVA